MSHLKSTIRDLLPAPILSAYRKYRYYKIGRANRQTTLEGVFTGIYTNQRWGGQPGSFFSGPGSHEASMVRPYIQKVSDELAILGASAMTAVDLGCGDFSVGRQLATACGRYIGLDIVRPLIEYNQAVFGDHRVQFQHANIIEDDLPDGDVCFVREVLQHLSNAQILSVLPKLARYRWSFITEHHPCDERLRRPNLDKPHGADIRVSRGSGIFLDEPPFSVAKNRLRTILEVPYVRGSKSSVTDDPGVLRTYVMTGTGLS